MPQTMTPEVILAAIAGFQLQRTQIDNQIEQLRGMLNGRRTPSAVTPAETGKRKRKRFSLASRRKMAAAQKARWAGIKQGSKPTKAVTTKPKRKPLGASARKRIGAATRKRWALKRAAAKKAA